MKKILALLIVIASFTLSLSACVPEHPEGGENVKIRIAYMNGPTCMGMA